MGPILFATWWFTYAIMREKDYEIDPKITFLVLLGSCFIVMTTLVLNTIATINALIFLLFFPQITSEELLIFLLEVITIVLVAPLVEEFAKALPNLLFYFSKRKNNFLHTQKDGLLDFEGRGVFHAILIGSIFTVLETYLYVFLNLPALGTTNPLDYWIQVFVRSMAPIHLAGATLTGYGIAKADRLRTAKKRSVFLENFFPFYFLAVGLHLSWNGSLVYFAYFSPFPPDIAEILSIVLLLIIGISSYSIIYLGTKKGYQKCDEIKKCDKCGFQYCVDEVACPYCTTAPEEHVHPYPDLNVSYTHCSKCNRTFPLGFKYCTFDGSPLSIVCGNCGNSLEAGVNFCDNCGTPLTAQYPRWDIPKKDFSILAILMLVGNSLLGAGLTLGGVFIILLLSDLFFIGIYIMAFGILSFIGVVGVMMRKYYGWYINLLFLATTVSSFLLILGAAIGLLYLILGFNIFSMIGTVIVVGIAVIVLFLVRRLILREEELLTLVTVSAE